MQEQSLGLESAMAADSAFQAEGGEEDDVQIVDINFGEFEVDPYYGSSSALQEAPGGIKRYKTLEQMADQLALAEDLREKLSTTELSPEALAQARVKLNKFLSPYEAKMGAYVESLQHEDKVLG